MTRTLIVSGLSLVLALGAGCSKKEGAAGGGAGGAKNYASMSMDQLCDEMIGMMDSMGKVVESNKGKCDDMGKGLQAWADSNKSFMEFAKAQDKDEAKKKEFEAKCEPKMKPVMEKMMGAMMGAMECKDNAGVKKALESMGG